MELISYRGPGGAGGVAGALSRLFRRQENESTRWWHLSQNLVVIRSGNKCPDYVSKIESKIVEGHYRYCNNFLWPILHDIPQLASFSELDRECFQKFHLAIAHAVLRQPAIESPSGVFIQDYQLALMPLMLAGRNFLPVNIFWHIPWPRNVREDHLAPVKEIAISLLEAHKLGFHTTEYVQNFLGFVDAYLPGYKVDFATSSVECLKPMQSEKTVSIRRVNSTKVKVHPLGLDSNFWAGNAKIASAEDLKDPLSISTPLVLSVDRADYTKGVLQRLQAIDFLFKKFPELAETITFVQICQPSRQGLGIFDSYWNECNKLADNVNSRWQTDSWVPLHWIKTAKEPEILARYYASCDFMLVNPLRDGLNLTAKEFVACAKPESMLLLSTSAGVWHELGQEAVEIDPNCPELLAMQIKNALSVPKGDKINRMLKLKQKVKRNDLSHWWKEFTDDSPDLPIRTERKAFVRSVDRVSF